MKTISPCIRLCTLNDEKICLGCGRSLQEIGLWSRWSDQEKNAWWAAQTDMQEGAINEAFVEIKPLATSCATPPKADLP